MLMVQLLAQVGAQPVEVVVPGVLVVDLAG
jgi:hypothetical protein